MANEWIIKMGIIDETRMMQIMLTIYEDLAMQFRQWKNISLEIVDISKENLRHTLDKELQEGADWLFFPCEMSLFSAERSPNSPRFSLASMGTSTYILSTTPNKRTVSSLHFLNMESAFVGCLLSSLMFISAVIALINRVQRFRANWTLRNIGHQFLENLWRIILVFFFEPLIETPRKLSWRIVVSVWLIAISFIYIDMCANLNSKFTKTEYDYVDSMPNLPKDRYKDVIVFKDYVEEVFINKMAEIDDNYRELKERMKRMEIEDLFDLSFRNLIKRSEYLIVAEVNGKIGLKELLKISGEVPPRGLISFSEPLYSTFIVFPVSSNASLRTAEVINALCLMELELKLMSKYFNEMDYLFFGMKWTKPEDTFQDMTVADLKSVLNLYIFGSLLTVFILIVELLTALVRKNSNFSSKRRRNRMVQKFKSVLIY